MQRVCRRPGCPCLPARRPRWWVAVAPGAPLTLACPLERKKREVTVSEGHSGPHARGHSLCRSQVPVTEARSVVKAGRGVTVTCVSFKGTFSVSAVRRVSGLVTRKVGVQLGAAEDGVFLWLSEPAPSGQDCTGVQALGDPQSV